MALSITDKDEEEFDSSLLDSKVVASKMSFAKESKSLNAKELEQIIVVDVSNKNEHQNMHAPKRKPVSFAQQSAAVLFKNASLAGKNRKTNCCYMFFAILMIIVSILNAKFLPRYILKFKFFFLNNSVFVYSIKTY